MRTLFAKFLVWLWLGLILILGVEIALETTTLEGGLSLHPERAKGPFTLYADLARDALARDGQAGLDSLVLRFDAQPDLVAFRYSPGPPDGAIHELPGGASRAGLASLQAGRSVLIETPEGLFLGYPIGSSVGREFALVLHPEHGVGRGWSGWRGWLTFLPVDLGVRALVTLLIGGLLSFLMVRHITSPVTRLRQATRRLAAGDLGARVGSAGRRRRDELEDLGRDFDRMAERLESLVGAQRRLLTDISHELRSPLARMNVAINFLREDGVEQAPAMIERLEIESDRLNRLIGDALLLSRAESGEPVPAFQPVDLVELCRQVAHDAQFEAGARVSGIHVRASGPVEAMGVEELLRSAVENVVRNAIRHTRPGSAIEIELARVDGGGQTWARIAVHDQGPGLPEDQLEKIFEPFYRFEGASEPASGGTGLGLAIVRRVVARHAGSTRAHSAPGGGLTIEIQLPMHAGQGSG